MIWSKECFQEHMKKQANGIVYLDEPLKIIKRAIKQFALASSVKKCLTEVVERVGYELYLFMSETTLNTCCPKQFLSSGFSEYTVDDVNIWSDVKWTLRGEISATETLTSYMKNHLNASQLLMFMCACEICDKFNVMLMWNRLSDEQKNQIRKSRCWSKNHLFLNYWLCFLDNNFDDFTRFYSNIILTFDERRSINYNLLKYSIMRCLRNNIAYFYSNLTGNEKDHLFDNVEISGKRTILFHVLQMETFWYIKYINKFFEVPLLNHKINKFIIGKLSKQSFKDLIEYNIQQINTFGDLHSNIFLYLMRTASDEVKVLVLEKLDFYVLSIISKGRLEPVVDHLLNGETRKVLREQIVSDLKNLSFSKFLRVCMNGYSDLLARFFDVICDNNDDRLFLKSRLKSIIEGTQYEDL